MAAQEWLDKLKALDLQSIQQEFQGLDPNDPGQWPLIPRIVCLAAIFISCVVSGWWFDWSDQLTNLTTKEAEEQTLKEEWLTKKRQAVNLPDYKRQLGEIDQQFGTLLKQLPNRSEMDALLADINQAGLGRGLQFDLFKPGSEISRDFYAELPITIRVQGTYHDLGAFVSDVAHMPRIVTLNDINIEAAKDGLLKLDATALTFRYLDDGEIATLRKNKKGGK
jgi:type IV pilus assembly protein PilO